MIIKTGVQHSLPMTVVDLREYCRAPSEDDSQLDAFLAAAVDHVETATSRVLAPVTMELRVDEWPWCERVITLPRSPVRTVRRVYYLDEDGAETEVSTDDWLWTRDVFGGAQVHLKDTFTYPTVYGQTSGAVRVEFDAGYDTDASGAGDDPELVVPPTALLLVKMLAAHWYDNRGVAGEEVSNRITQAADVLINQLRVYR